MGGEPLLRPDFVHKVVYYAAKRGFDAWDLKPGLPKALVPARQNLEYILRKQYVNGYVVFFNINICRNNLADVRQLTEFAHDHRVATDYHINETPMLEQDDHFKHLYDNPTSGPRTGARSTPWSTGSLKGIGQATRWSTRCSG